MRILIADDNSDSADSLAAILRHWGHDVQAVYDGDSTVTFARQFQPRVVFLDWEILKVNEGEVGRALRRDSKHPQMVIIAMAPFAADDKRIRRYAGCFDSYLSKPCDLNLLERTFSEASQQPVRTQRPQASDLAISLQRSTNS